MGDASYDPAAIHWPTVAEVEREHIRKTLEFAGYNQSVAAKMLGLDRHQLRRRMVKYGLDLQRSKPGRPARDRLPLRRAA